MLPDRVSNPGPLTYESGALPLALRGPALMFNNVALALCYHLYVYYQYSFTQNQPHMMWLCPMYFRIWANSLEIRLMCDFVGTGWRTQTFSFCPGPEVIKLFSCSTQLSMKF